MSTQTHYLKRLTTSAPFRRSENRGIVFGFTQLHALLTSAQSIAVQQVYHCGAIPSPLLPALERSRAAVTPVAASFLSFATTLHTPPAHSCAVVFSLPPLPTPAALLAGSARALVLDRISDPGNLGTLLRTCAALGWAALLSPGCCDPYNDKVLRSSCGATFQASWSHLTGSPGATGPQLLAQAEAPGQPTLTALLLPEAAAELRSLAALAAAPSCRLRLVLGSEAAGLSPAWRAAQAAPGSTLVQARIGPPGGVLNASVAAAIAMYALS